MIDRVAKALCAAVIAPGTMTQVQWSETLARAAIQAMREPTDAQRNAYFELSGRTEVMMDAHWERAIDAALSNGETQ